jgi:MOSC domain-containing protein YiiM
MSDADADADADPDADPDADADADPERATGVETGVGRAGDRTLDTRSGSQPRSERGRIEAIFVAEADGEPMERLDTVEAVEGGLAGDRYLTGTGHYVPHDVCEVTLVAGEAIDEIRAEHGIDLTDGRHRRNLVTRGVDVHELLGATVRVGDAVVRGTRPRPPCAHVERVAGERGVARALKQGRGGVCADVVRPGRIRVDDAVEVIEPDARTAGRRIADRLRGAIGSRSTDDEE